LSYRFAGIPAAPHEIQELFLLDLRLVGGDVRTVELYEPVAFDVMLHFFAGQLPQARFRISAVNTRSRATECLAK
jgi:hypothetical protein